MTELCGWVHTKSDASNLSDRLPFISYPFLRKWHPIRSTHIQRYELRFQLSRTQLYSNEEQHCWSDSHSQNESQWIEWAELRQVILSGVRWLLFDIRGYSLEKGEMSRHISLANATSLQKKKKKKFVLTCLLHLCNGMSNERWKRAEGQEWCSGISKKQPAPFSW